MPRRLDEMVVTASRIEEPSSDLPYATAAITRSMLEETSPRTLPDALREESSIMVQKTALGQGSPFIRGFTGFRTVLLIDGFRLNNSVFRDGPNQYWNTVDSWSVERLEVVKGPTSAQYGSDAIGGTVHARTIEPRWDGERPLAFAGGLHRWSSAEQSHVTRLQAGAGLGYDTAFVVGGTRKDFGDLRGGRDVGKQPKTGYDELDFDFKLMHRITRTANLTVAHQTVAQEDAWRTHATIYGLYWNGTRPGSNLVRVLDQRRNMTYVRLDAAELNGALSELHLGVAHHRQGEDEFRQRANLRIERQGFRVDTAGAYAHGRWDTRSGRWVAGAEFYRDWVDSFLREFDSSGALVATRVQGPVADDATHDLMGLFAEDRFSLGPRLEATMGGRLNHSRVRANKVATPGVGTSFAMSTSTASLAGSVRVLAILDDADRWKLFSGASQGVRSPNLSDLTRFDIAEAGQIETPVRQLDPERFVTGEIGVRGEFRRSGVELAYYHTWIEDLIVRTPTGLFVNGLAEVTKRNSGRGFIHGIEVTGHTWVTDQVSLRGVFTWMEGRLKSYPTVSPVLVEEPVSRLMPPTFVAIARWHRGPWSLNATATFAARADRLATQDRVDTERIPPGGTPGYGIYGIRAQWKPSTKFSITVAMENLLNDDYRIHGSGLNEPGRNLLITAGVGF